MAFSQQWAVKINEVQASIEVLSCFKKEVLFAFFGCK